MIKRNNKKGFTIVELVIVIAVIAILAAVLIPTFAGIVKKANLSADEQAVRQMNTALAMYEAENGKPANLVEAKKALDEALVNVEGGLVPVTQGYAFYWDKANNKVVLVGGDVTVQDGWELLSNNGFGTETKVSDVASLKDAIAASSSKEPAIIKLEKNLSISEEFNIEKGKAVTLDLNGNTLTASAKIKINETASVSIKDGTLQTAGIRNEKGSLSLKNVNMTDSASTAIFVYGFSDTSIVDSKIGTIGSWGIATNSTNSSADGARVTVENSEISAAQKPFFCSTNSNFVANNCTFIATTAANETAAVLLKDGSHEFNNCKLITPADCPSISFWDGKAGSYSGKLDVKFNDCEYYTTADGKETKVETVAIGYAQFAANATVSIDSEYAVSKIASDNNNKATGASTGSLTVNGKEITLN